MFDRARIASVPRRTFASPCATAPDAVPQRIGACSTHGPAGRATDGRVAPRTLSAAEPPGDGHSSKGQFSRK